MKITIQPATRILAAAAGSPAGRSFYNVKGGGSVKASASAPCARGDYRLKVVVKVMIKKGGSLGFSDPGYSPKLTRNPCDEEEFVSY